MEKENNKLLPFEKPIFELYAKIDDLRRLSENGDSELASEIKKIEGRAERLKKKIYSQLTTPQVVQIARHPARPDALSLAKTIFDDFIELHGDRCYRDDPSIIGGLGTLDKTSVMVIGHQKGHDTKENIKRNFGMPHPEGYRKALRLMRMAEKFNLPIVTFIDTPGAYPGLEAEERGQAEAIAQNLKQMMMVEVPIFTVVIGEGGSGGALGIGVSNKIMMLEYAIYSVISPEGCASILFRDAAKSDFAAENLKITAKDICQLGVADGIIKEPFGGAHRDWAQTARNIKQAVEEFLDGYKSRSVQKILAERYDKFRGFGEFSVNS